MVRAMGTWHIDQRGVRWGTPGASRERCRDRQALLPAIEHNISEPRHLGYTVNGWGSTLSLHEIPNFRSTLGTTACATHDVCPIEDVVEVAACQQLTGGPVEPHFGFETLRVESANPRWNYERLRNIAGWAPWKSIEIYRTNSTHSASEQALILPCGESTREIGVDVRTGDISAIARTTLQHLTELTVANYLLGARLLITGSREQGLHFIDALLGQQQLQPAKSYSGLLTVGGVVAGGVGGIATLIGSWLCDSNVTFYVGGAVACLGVATSNWCNRAAAREADRRKMLRLPAIELAQEGTLDHYGFLKSNSVSQFGGLVRTRTTTFIGESSEPTAQSGTA